MNEWHEIDKELAPDGNLVFVVDGEIVFGYCWRTDDGKYNNPNGKIAIYFSFKEDVSSITPTHWMKPEFKPHSN